MEMTRKVMKSIKARAVSQSITQVDLSDEFDVSLATVKRWYSGKGISLEQMNNLCTFLGVELSDIIKSVENSKRAQFHYTLEQEKFLLKEPDLLAFFDNIIRGNSVNKIKKKFAISNLKINKYLSALDKLELLEWYPGDKVKLLVEGEPVWRKNGPLSLRYRPQIFEEFLKAPSQKENFILGDLLDDDIEIINERFQDLSRFATAATKRASLYPEKSKPYGIFYQVKKYLWSFDSFF